MKALRKNPIIQHRPETLQEVRKLFRLEKPEVLNESLDILQDWINQQSYFNKKDFDRDYLERFIVRAKGSIEKSKKRLDDMCTYRTLYPHMYEVVKVNEMTNVNTVYQFILPKQTKDHCTIFFSRNFEKDYGEAFAENFYKRVIVLLEFLYHYDYNAGVIIISDLRETAPIKQMTELINPFVRQLAHQTLTTIVKVHGARFRGIHFLTDSNAMEKMVSFLKQFFGKTERIFIHKNLESLHEHFDKDLLPKDYGGKEEPSDSLYEKCMSFLSSDEMLKNLEKMSNATVDTNLKKISDAFETDLGISGTFRKLNVD